MFQASGLKFSDVSIEVASKIKYKKLQERGRLQRSVIDIQWKYLQVKSLK